MKVKGHRRGLVAFILLVIMISLLTACTEDEFDLEESSVSENLLSPEDKDNPVDHTQSSENTVPEIQKPLEYVETEDMAQYDDEFFCTVLRNGLPATEENVRALLISLESKYPEGTVSADCGMTAATLIGSVFGERASCMIISDPSLEEFRPGDEMHYSSDEIPAHNVVVIDRVYEQDENGNEVFIGLAVAEGNYLEDMKYHWGRVIRQSDVEAEKIHPRMRYYYYRED